MRRNFNKVINFNETDQTITVEAGMSGPQLEKILSEAKTRFGARHAYSRVHEKVRAFAKSRPNTVCMTHLSHAYEQGANLYFIFIGKFRDKEEYAEYQFGIFDNIMEQGAAMSHHHGVGKMTAA